MSGRDYHFILTFQLPMSNGYRVRDVEGVITIGSETRQDAFLAIRSKALAAIGQGADETPAVLFFSMEPNDLMSS